MAAATAALPLPGLQLWGLFWLGGLPSRRTGTSSVGAPAAVVLVGQRGSNLEAPTTPRGLGPHSTPSVTHLGRTVALTAAVPAAGTTITAAAGSLSGRLEHSTVSLRQLEPA